MKAIRLGAARLAARPTQLFRTPQLRMLCTAKKGEVTTTDGGGQSGDLSTEVKPMVNKRGEVRVRTAAAPLSLSHFSRFDAADCEDVGRDRRAARSHKGGGAEGLPRSDRRSDGDEAGSAGGGAGARRHAKGPVQLRLEARQPNSIHCCRRQKGRTRWNFGRLFRYCRLLCAARCDWDGRLRQDARVWRTHKHAQ